MELAARVGVGHTVLVLVRSRLGFHGSVVEGRLVHHRGVRDHRRSVHKGSVVHGGVVHRGMVHDSGSVVDRRVVDGARVV